MSNTITPCLRCGEQMLPGQRFEATQTVAVLVCLNGCGAEFPPLGRCCQRGQMVKTNGCGHCGAAISQRAKFCSVACYAANNRKDVVGRTCPCGVQFDVPTYRLYRGDRSEGGRYCSPACQRAYRAKKGAA